MNHVVISTIGRKLQGRRKYPHQPRFLALLGMTPIFFDSQDLHWIHGFVKLMTLPVIL